MNAVLLVFGEMLLIALAVCVLTLIGYFFFFKNPSSECSNNVAAPEEDLTEPGATEKRSTEPVVSEVNTTEPGTSEVCELPPVATEECITELVASKVSSTASGTPEVYITGPAEPEVSSAEPGTPEVCITGPAEPEVSSAEPGTPEVCITGPAEPEVSSAELGTPEVYKTGPAEPEVSSAELGTPEVYITEPTDSEVSLTELATPEICITRPAEPEVSSTEPVASEVSSVEEATPKVFITGPAQPEVNSTEPGTPEVCITEPTPKEVTTTDPVESELCQTGPVTPEVSSAKSGATEECITDAVKSNLIFYEPTVSEESVTQPAAAEVSLTQLGTSEEEVSKPIVRDLSLTEQDTPKLSITEPDATASVPLEPVEEIIATSVVQLQVHPEEAVELTNSNANVVELTAVKPLTESEPASQEEILEVAQEGIQPELVMNTPVQQTQEGAAAESPVQLTTADQPEPSRPVQSENVELHLEQQTEHKPETEQPTVQNAEQANPDPEASQAQNVLDLSERELKSVKFTVGESSAEDFSANEEMENKIMNEINVEIGTKTSDHAYSGNAHNQYQRINNRLSHSSPSKYSGSKLATDHSSLSKIVENEFEDLGRGDIVEACTLENVAEMDKPKLVRQETMYESAEVVTFCSRYVPKTLYL